MSYKENLKELDIIIVYNKKSWLHRLVYGFTGYKAGHVAIHLGNLKIIEANSTGVKIKPCKNYTKNHRIVLATAKGFKNVPAGYINERQHAILRYCDKKLNTKYAYGQIIILWLKYIFKLKSTPDISKKAMICSEFVANAFLAGDIKLSHLPAHETTPGHIMSSDEVDIRIY